MASFDDLIHELAHWCGIIPEYWDIFGLRHEASLETKRAILSAMGMPVDDYAALETEVIHRRDGVWRRFLEPVHVITINEQPLAVTTHLPVIEGDERDIVFVCTITDEQDATESHTITSASQVIGGIRHIDDVRHAKVTFTIPGRRDLGYYTLRVECWGTDQNHSAVSRLIIAPEACHMPPLLDPAAPDRKKIWGLCLNLYALKSEKNWGFGDFTNLRDIATWSAGLGADFVGINPLHALPNKKPAGISPYSPTSRIFKNPLYLDMESVPGAGETDETRRLLASIDYRDRLFRLREAEALDYEGVAASKLRMLHAAFASFYQEHHICGTDLGKAFHAFLEREGEMLDAWAMYMALCDEFGVSSWGDWPDEYRGYEEKPFWDFRRFHEKEIVFHKYVQWLIELQHEAAAIAASGAGMGIGLYHDLAVGSAGSGFDCWRLGRAAARSIDVGAPPDDFNPAGQNWGFPPIQPEAMREHGYEFFIELLRRNMRHAGAIRIDHALGLFRLFWIPAGMLALHGAYVRYPVEEMLRIIALESVRNKTIVIAEDLGTVTDEVHAMLRRYGMLSYKLFYFERNYPDPAFKAPEQYEPVALCAVTTHDLPTLPGFWAGRDLEVKRALGLFRSDEQREHHFAVRENDRKLMLEALKAQGLFPRRFPADPHLYPVFDEPLCLAVYEYLARSNSMLMGVSMDDLLGVLDQQNLPGTVDEHPNWIRKLPINLDELMQLPVFRHLSRALRTAGR